MEGPDWLKGIKKMVSGKVKGPMAVGLTEEFYKDSLLDDSKGQDD